MRALVQRCSANPNTPDTKYGRTPLCRAAKNENLEIGEILLKQNDVDPNIADQHGLTPIAYVVQNEDLEVVTILVQQNDTNPSSPDDVGRAPLSYVAENGIRKS